MLDGSSGLSSAASSRVATSGFGGLAAVLLRWPIAIEAAFLLSYATLRTFGLGRDSLLLWMALALATALVAPVTGMVILAGIAPFSGPFALSTQFGGNGLLVLAIGLSVSARVVWHLVAARSTLRRPPVPIWLAAGVFLGTALGVAETYLRFGPTRGAVAAQVWWMGIGGAMVLLGAGYWAARRHQLRPMAVALGTSVVAAVVGLIDFLDRSGIRDSAVRWLVRQPPGGERLTGVIPSPNGVAALLIVPALVLAGAVLFHPSVRARMAAALVAVPVFAALFFTYSRSPLLAAYVAATIFAWKVRRALGVGVLCLGLLGAIIFLPSYLDARGRAVGEAGGLPTAGQVFNASDQMRLRAWGAATRMWLDEPLTGHGFMSFYWLADSYGETVLGGPHNDWLRLFAEEGTLVGGLGLAFVAASLATMLRGRDWLSIGIVAASAGWMLALTFNNPVAYLQVNVTAMLTLAVGLSRALDPPTGLRRTGPLGSSAA